MKYSMWHSNAFLCTMMLFIALSFSSCFEEVKIPSGCDLPSRHSNVNNYYISGTSRDGIGAAVATLWKKGVPVNLLASYPDAVVYTSAGFGMAVSGKDVYVCGAIYTSKGTYPIFWKNGQPILLTPGTGEARAIVVVGADVYVAGFISNDNGSLYGVIWKNGIGTNLTAGEIQSVAHALVVSGNNIYVGGYLVKEGKTYGTYWKNGNPVLVTSGDNYAEVRSLAVKGATVYTAGIEAGDPVGKYWKNADAVTLTDGSSKVIVSTVQTTGKDVYVAGTRYNGINAVEMIVWKNNTIVSTTPLSANDLMVSTIKTLNNKVLVTGSIIYRNDNSSVYGDATVWTDGVPSTLEQGADGTNVYFANSIEVISKNQH
jgi:hypothetical protein